MLVTKHVATKHNENKYGHQSVDDLLKALIKEHKINRMQGNVDKLRERVDDIAAVDVEHLVQRLNLSPLGS